MTSDSLCQQFSLALDVTRLVGVHLEQRRATGIDRVLQAYAEQFRATARAVLRWRGRHYVLDNLHSRQLLDWLAAGQSPENLWRWLVVAVVRSWPQRDISGYWLINAGHSGLEQLGYVEELRRIQVRPVIMIHDIIPLTHPEYNRDGEFSRHHQRVQVACSCARLIICVSAATAESLRLYAVRQGWQVPAIEVTRLGVPATLPQSRRRDEAAAYFIVISTIEARKNHLMLLQIWRDWVDAGRTDIPKLILVGKRGWEAEQTFDLLDRCQQLRGIVEEIPDCDDVQLMHLLTGARALLFPSFAEGFGLPVLEALQHGVPVLATDLPVFREFAGDVPDYLSVLDYPAWQQALLDYAKATHPRRQAQLQRMDHFSPPQWAGHFAILQTWIAAQHE